MSGRCASASHEIVEERLSWTKHRRFLGPDALNQRSSVGAIRLRRAPGRAGAALLHLKSPLKQPAYTPSYATKRNAWLALRLGLGAVEGPEHGRGRFIMRAMWGQLSNYLNT